METLNWLDRSSLVALIENRARAEQIVGVVVRYGLADLSTLSSHPHIADLAKGVAPDPALAELSRGERLGRALQELGTTFIKIGQILSTRADLVGPEIAADLAALQADDPADSSEQIASTIASTLGESYEEAYSSIDLTPVASASVAQVCMATTVDGTPVAVKVRHAGVVEQVAQDLAILNALAQIAEKEIPALRSLQPARVARELSRSLEEELDFRRELANLMRVTANFADSTAYVFPTPFPELSGSAVLTESVVEGTRLSAVIDNLGPHADDVIHAITDLYFHMIFVDGFFHADPHPGNLLILDDGRLGVLDFGKCGRLRDGMRESFVDFLAAVFGDDIEEATRCMLAVAPGPRTLDISMLSADLDDWIATYFPASSGGLPDPHTNLGGAVQALLSLVSTYQLRMPADMALMLLVVMQLQGLLEESGSSLTLTQLLMPYAQQLRQERMSPKRLLRSVTRTAHRWERLLDVLPGDLTRLFEAGSQGELKVPLEVNGLDRPVNRLAYALVASAAISGATTLLGRRTQPTVRDVSVPGVIATAASAFLAIEVVRGVRRSGGL